MMDPFQNNMATQFGRFRILFRKSFIENVYINILKNIFFCNSFYLFIFLKHLRCFFTNAYGVRICSACGGNSRRHFGRTMCLHTKDTSTGQPTAGRSKLPSAAGVFRKILVKIFNFYKVGKFSILHGHVFVMIYNFETMSPENSLDSKSSLQLQTY